MNRSAAFLIFMVIVILAGCRGAAPTTNAQDNNSGQTNETPVTGNEDTYKDITPEVLKSQLAKKDFTLINVHIPFAGNLPQTDLSIPYDQIEQNLEKLPAEKNAKIVLYCSSGHMSSIAAKKLVELGYTNVWNLAGGMSAWRKDGFQLEEIQ